MKNSILKTFLYAASLAVAMFGNVQARAEGVTPVLYIIGDSTVKNGAQGLKGGGEVIAPYFDPAKIKVENCALGGRSSRTFMTEGLWDKVLAKLKAGDYVMMQFGHNDAGKVSGEFAPGRAARASLKGNGDETEEALMASGPETVHTYGWYLRKFCADAKAKGAHPIVLSMVPRNDWKDGKVARASDNFGKWAAEAAQASAVPFLDLNRIVADHYDQMGQENVKGFFPKEHTHTSPEGAQLNAKSVVEGVKELKDCPLKNYLR